MAKYESEYLSEIEKDNIIRLGLQGEAGSGKSTAAATFPNPIFCNFDNGIQHLSGKVKQVRFWDRAWVKGFLAKHGKSSVAEIKTVLNSHLALKVFLLTEAMKMTKEDTLVIDSWTTLQDCIDAILEADGPYMNKKGEENPYTFWDLKQDKSQEIIDALLQLNCNSVVIFHEIKQRDPKTGELLEKIQPLMKGGFLPKLKKYFPYFFRQLAAERDGVMKYVWQTKSSRDFDAKSLKELPQYVEANYKSFLSQ